jgi:hypothetical protein
MAANHKGLRANPPAGFKRPAFSVLRIVVDVDFVMACVTFVVAFFLFAAIRGIPGDLLPR